MGFKFMEKLAIRCGIASPILFCMTPWHPFFGLLGIVAIIPIGVMVAGAIYFHLVESLSIGCYQIREWWRNTRLW